jgi:hypothetical protein
MWSATGIIHDFFPLVGGHAIQDCFGCHEQGGDYTGLSQECFSCHEQDYNSVTDPNHIQNGFPTDCTQCHSINGWKPATLDHDQTNFPLTGAHISVDCSSCHTDGFTGTPTDCNSCHQQDYESVMDPNHVTNSYALDCTQCHNTASWSTTNFDHNLTAFELTGAHLSTDCSACHQTGYEGTPADCFSCHDGDYNNSVNPNHQAAGFPTTCEDCHSTSVWTPANFDHDGQYFPILTGKHAGKWDLCIDCHSVPSDYSVFSCITCHEHRQSEMDPKHSGIDGYSYESSACFSCHPTGDKEGAFNHALTNFPLTGSHTTVDCLGCHENGYSNTPTDCISCHQQNYNESTNPNHQVLALSTECNSCHTTDPNWQPASFSIHGQFYQLFGAHNIISEDCNSCHSGDYNNTPNTCFGCHEDAYNATTDPPHQALNFSQDCIECHDQSKWIPSNFDHDGQYFPILTGKHAGKWDLCVDCHNVASDYSVFSCITCHEHRQSEMDPKHSGIDGYSYESSACLSCHPTGDKDGAFNHALSNFPLTGSHITVDCLGCHENGYSNTPIDCVSCHQQHYNESTNPDHQVLVLSTECNSCHTTDPNWQPASFAIHDQFYNLIGAHQQISNDCNSCHNGNYVNTSSQCLSCHQSNYNNAPDHLAQNFPTNCELCHNFNVWNETSFNHANTNFPLTGAHQAVDCSLCHESGYSGTSTVCNDCHQPDYQQSANPNHAALALSTDCETCHSTDANWQPAQFPIHDQFYQLVGAHNTIIDNCGTCNNGNYNNTPNTCIGCHQNEYNGANDPPHQTLNLSLDCMECHNQNRWTPASFDHNFYPVSGRHDNVNCNECHSESGYQPQCLDCHQGDFRDGHDSGDPTDCWSCHSKSNWDTGNRGFKIKRAH